MSWLPLSGNTYDRVVFNNLLHFSVKSDDSIIDYYYLQNSQKNTTYILHRIQNDIVYIKVSVISNTVFKRV